MKRIYIIGILAVLFSACTPSIKINKNASAGNAVFTNYLAIGNSLTAGYTDGSLTVSGQLNSYPNMLFTQFSQIPVNGAVGPFVQPMVAGDYGYPGPKYILSKIYNPCTGDTSLGPVLYNGTLDSTGDYVYTSSVNNGQINNIGVPGIRIADYPVAFYASITALGGVPYAKRFYSANAITPLDELNIAVGNLHPSFFTMWLGANDVLQYALAGGRGMGADGTARIQIPPNFYNTQDITPFQIFDSCYDKALNAAIATGAGGALVNIPDITSLPYFTTIPAQGLILTRQGQADTLNALYPPPVTRNVFQVGANYFIIKDHNKITRQAVPGELILLNTPQDSLTCASWGSVTPIPDSLVLTTEEIQFIELAIQSYNSFIQHEASLHHLAYVDMNAYFRTLQSGITYDGIRYSPQFVTGGAFSLDGIHPTQRGYALIANQMIATINQFYKSNVPSLDVNKYKGVTFP